MILYTKEPISSIFPEEPAAARVERLPHGYAELTDGKTAGEGPRLQRIFSTDPKDYLNPRLQPGSKMQLENKS